MIKFVLLLTSAITFNFAIAFGEMLGIVSDSGNDIHLEFSEKPIEFESGQPVYPISTKVFVVNSVEKELSISVNGRSEITKVGSKIDISEVLKPHADTYTVEVETLDRESNSIHKIFGFTTR